MIADSIHSIGHAAQLLQVMPGRITQAAKVLGIEPAARINGIDHYDESALERIGDHLRTKKESSNHA
jgi:hypothetical protein